MDSDRGRIETRGASASCCLRLCLLGTAICIHHSHSQSAYRSLKGRHDLWQIGSMESNSGQKRRPLVGGVGCGQREKRRSSRGGYDKNLSKSNTFCANFWKPQNGIMNSIMREEAVVVFRFDGDDGHEWKTVEVATINTGMITSCPLNIFD